MSQLSMTWLNRAPIRPKITAHMAPVMIVSSDMPAFFARRRVSTTPTTMPRNMRMPCQPMVKEPNSAMLGSMPMCIRLLLLPLQNLGHDRFYEGLWIERGQVIQFLACADEPYRDLQRSEERSG